MLAEHTNTLPRKKPSIYWWLGGGFLLLFCLFLFRLFGPNPPVVVSLQTTYITSPLNANGLPDYEQHYLKFIREGVTPENNAAALLFEALGPGEISWQDAELVAKELGLPDVPSRGATLRRLYGPENRKRVAAWLHKLGRLTLPQRTPSDKVIQQVLTLSPWPPTDDDAAALLDVVDAAIGRASTRPWSSEQFPPLADWVRENQSNLDKIVAAARRPRYYYPSPSLLNGESDRLLTASFDFISPREAARALGTRAMRYLGEGRTKEAWDDTFAIHRLAQLLTDGRTVIGQLIANALSGFAFEATLAVLDQKGLSAEQARQIQRDLAALPAFSMTVAIDKGERLQALDAIVGYTAGRRAGTAMAKDADAQVLPGLDFISLDWNVVLTETNSCFDQLAAAAALPTRQRRVAAIAAINVNLEQRGANVHSVSSLAASAFSQKRRSQLVSDITSNLFLPAFQSVANAQDRTNAKLDLLRTAVALAIYRAEQRHYPQRLSELVPGTISTVPLDLYTGKAFLYRPFNAGYLLYSVGENGADDGGSNEMQNIFEGISLEDGVTSDPPPQIPSGADDLSIRLPQPPLKPPQASPAQ